MPMQDLASAGTAPGSGVFLRNKKIAPQRRSLTRSALRDKDKDLKIAERGTTHECGPNLWSSRIVRSRSIHSTHQRSWEQKATLHRWVFTIRQGDNDIDLPKFRELAPSTYVPQASANQSEKFGAVFLGQIEYGTKRRKPQASSKDDLRSCASANRGSAVGSDIGRTTFSNSSRHTKNPTPRRTKESDTTATSNLIRQSGDLAPSSWNQLGIGSDLTLRVAAPDSQLPTEFSCISALPTESEGFCSTGKEPTEKSSVVEQVARSGDLLPLH
ncbi:unnamed protein product [Nesidiocoris tenuis]|uniref:Uncharacterized protein n=1 Tax=Nesidiocoris tenuis TaxID=355587 RepID=A0A6H5HSR4_9HEMI|nr:unnamed protein product [Nesidiocoris tenuis]